MFGKKKEKQGQLPENNPKSDKKSPKKQKNIFSAEDENEFEDLMEDLDNYN